MNLKIKDRTAVNNLVDIAEFEKRISQQSIQLEKDLVKEKLDEVASRYTQETLVIEGISYRRRLATTQVSIGRVSLQWNRPIYQGSKNGMKVRHYPADLDLNIPRKTTSSYQVLTNCALLAAFLPFSVCKKILKLLMGVDLSESSIKRYSESVGEFANENFEAIVEKRKNSALLGENEILISSIDGSSSLINGTAARSNKKRKNKSKKKQKKFSKDDYLKEAKVFRLSVYNTKSKRITRTIIAHALIRQKEEVKTKLIKMVKLLEIPESLTIHAIADGAPWVKDVLESIHSNVDFQLDFYHAASYVRKVGELSFYTRNRRGSKKAKKLCGYLKRSGGKQTVARIKAIQKQVIESDLSKSMKKADLAKLTTILTYLEPRIESMEYQKALQNMVPIGSGFIESACKVIVKQRLGISGGRFYLEAAERIMMLRCIFMMDAWEDLSELIYRKSFSISHCQPSSSYEPVIKAAA